MGKISAFLSTSDGTSRGTPAMIKPTAWSQSTEKKGARQHERGRGDLPIGGGTLGSAKL